MVKNLSANAGDIRDSDLIPGSGRSPTEEPGGPQSIVSQRVGHDGSHLVCIYARTEKCVG